MIAFGTSDTGLEAILADPSNDAPRLVWADREGGERGELVVVQCALAGRTLSREERRRLKARETELVSWASEDGLGAGLSGTFVRGFVERVSVDLGNLDEVWARAPLCSFLSLRGTSADVSASGPRPEEAWAGVAERLAKAFAVLPASRVLGMSSSAEVIEQNINESVVDDRSHFGFGDDFVRLVASAAPLRSVTELCVYEGALSARAISSLARLPRLRRLRGDFQLSGANAVALLRAVPSLRQFGPWSRGLRGAELRTLLAAPEVARLTELDLCCNSLEEEDLVQLGTCTRLAGLERLAIGFAAKSQTIEPLTRAPHFGRLEELNLFGFRGSLNASALTQSSFGSGLRVLEAHGARVDGGDVSALLSMPSLERVRVSVGPQLRAALEAVIPEVEV